MASSRKGVGANVLSVAMLLAGCGGSFRGNASAGPNAGGGFYVAPNIDIGRLNPQRVLGGGEAHRPRKLAHKA